MRDTAEWVVCIEMLLVQITIPFETVDGCPVGLGLIGPYGSDESLLEAAEKFQGILQSQ